MSDRKYNSCNINTILNELSATHPTLYELLDHRLERLMPDMGQVSALLTWARAGRAEMRDARTPTKAVDDDARICSY
jgi:hypothetical protein